MNKQSLVLNVIPFKEPVKEKEFSFQLKRMDGFCPIHKGDVKDVIAGVIDDTQLDEGKWLYTDFEQAGDQSFSLEIDLTKSIHFASHFYRFLIREYFGKKADAIRRNYTNEIEVWFKSDTQRDNRYTLYDLFTLKIQHKRVSDSPELVVSYDGTTKVLSKNILNLNNLPLDDLRLVKCGKELYDYRKLPDNLRHKAPDTFPILSNKIKPHFNIAPDKTEACNRYIKYWKKLTDFYNNYLNTAEFKKILPLAQGGFYKVQSNNIQTTLPGSKGLLFGGGKISTEPKKDVRKYGPYRPADKLNIRFIFIYEKSERNEALSTLYKSMKFGLQEKQKDGTTIETFPSIENYIKQPINIYAEDGSIPFTNIDTAEEEIRRGAKLLHKKDGVQYIAIYISPVSKDVQNEKHRNVYYRVKEILLQEGIASQVIVKKNITNPNFKYFLPNIEIAILAKLGGIPWRLDRKDSNDLVVGIGAFYSTTRKTRYIGSTSCFHNDGTFKGFDCFQADDTKLLAGSIRRAVTTYVAEFEKIERLIIHFYKDISKRELQPIQETLHKLGLNIPVIVVTINKTESKELLAFDTDNPNLMPYSGTILKVGRREYLLFNNTRYDAYSNVTLKEYHFPIKISVYCDKQHIIEDENTITELMDQIYQFSRMYWKSVSQQNLPVTIKYPAMVAEFFPHFKSNTLPEYARKTLWVL